MAANRIILRDINQCIYCHTKEGKLTQEHIVPFGLNGEHILLHASCSKCAAITSKIELSVLKETFIAARKHLNLKSRRNKAWEKAEDVFSTLIFPITEPPAYLTNKAYASGVNVKGLQIIPLSDVKTKGSVTNVRGNDFERMLAKIGLGFAIGKFGIDAFESFYVLPAILGLRDDIGRWVGTVEAEKPNDIETIYVVDIQNSNDEIICRIRLFSMFIVPEYMVVVGKLKCK